MDDLTTNWIRNKADARAAANGCRFDIARAAFPVWWIGRYCRLYEGSHAGEPVVLRGAHSQSLEASQNEWANGGREWTVQRIREYMECRTAGERCDWQLEVVCRLFGWVKHCERLNKETRRFTKGAVFVAKKNKKTPTCAAIATYLACGDNEPGQKVFLCASNLEQANIAARHAMEMVYASPELLGECEISKTDSEIRHLPTKSILRPLSSGDVRSKKAKEGLNGSAMIDEIHVVDSDYMARIVRMGISRDEPFILSFSTAGDDTESFGYQEWLYGTKNNRSGEDENYFFESYEAPQGVSDADLGENLNAYLAMANPALGHTVAIDEARRDYFASRVSQKRLAEFKQYRLNIWSRTSTPWINGDDWAKSVTRRQRTIQHDEPCWAGLALGYTDEPSALTIVFPEDHFAIDDILASGKPEEIAQLAMLDALDQPVRAITWYWLPHATVDQWKHVLPYEDWTLAAAVKLQPGAAIDQNKLALDIGRIVRRYDVQAIAYDPWQASAVLGDLRVNTDFPIERQWEFPHNSPKQWQFPCALLERLVLRGRLKRKKNIAMDWEMAHANIKTDRQGGVSLVKPERGDRKTVNGPASLIMALDAMARAPRHYRSELLSIGGDSAASTKGDGKKLPPRGRLIEEYWRKHGTMPTPRQLQELMEVQ